MKNKCLSLLILAGLLALAGCSTYQGASADQDGYYYGRDAGPMGSPTMRPGINPIDPRDPNALTRPFPQPGSP